MNLDYFNNLLITNKNDFQIICPLCRTVSNNFIPYVGKANDKFLKGVTFAELFYIYANDSDYSAFETYCLVNNSDKILLSVSNFIEKIISTQIGSHFLLKDFVKMGPEKYYNTMKVFFYNSLFMTDVLRLWIQ